MRGSKVSQSSATFLPLYTSEGAPLVKLVCARMCAVFSRRWPILDQDRLRIGIELIPRQVISHVVLPPHPWESVGDNVAAVLTDYLTGRPA